MGTRMGPSYANLFLGKFEHNALLRASYKPYLWLRFIDDIFMIWTEGLEKLEVFVDYFNDNSHSSIKFTCTNSFNNIPFLDVMVSVKDGFIETDFILNLLTGAKHQYLLISSCYLITLNALFVTALHFAFPASVTAITVTYSVLMHLLTTLTILATTKPFSPDKYSVPQTFLVLTHLKTLKTNLLHGLKPFLLLLNITLHCLMSRTLFTNIPTSSTPQNVVKMFLKTIQ